MATQKFTVYLTMVVPCVCNGFDQVPVVKYQTHKYGYHDHLGGSCVTHFS